MKLKFLAIPALVPTEAEAELNEYLDSHRVFPSGQQFLADDSAAGGSHAGGALSLRRRPARGPNSMSCWAASLYAPRAALLKRGRCYSYA